MLMIEDLSMVAASITASLSIILLFPLAQPEALSKGALIFLFFAITGLWAITYFLMKLSGVILAEEVA
jgi:hypothetical protein